CEVATRTLGRLEGELEVQRGRARAVQERVREAETSASSARDRVADAVERLRVVEARGKPR
ncbi:MAG: hypothetical protein H0T79_14520, partial [Deltaproteobacteria bacterium]|nr:hypothetical protein [Deltaproteobacteria bacterium]